MLRENGGRWVWNGRRCMRMVDDMCGMVDTVGEWWTLCEEWLK